MYPNMDSQYSVKVRLTENSSGRISGGQVRFNGSIHQMGEVWQKKQFTIIYYYWCSTSRKDEKSMQNYDQKITSLRLRIFF
jgi:hypothetical protein